MRANAPAPAAVCEPSLLLHGRVSTTSDPALLKTGAKITWHAYSLTLTALLISHRTTLIQHLLADAHLHQFIWEL